MTAHIEDLLPPAMRAAFPGVRVVTETPAKLASAVPVVQVVGIGGTGDRYQFDAPHVDIDVFDGPHDNQSARANARDLAQRVHDWLLQQLPGQILGDVAVLSASEFMAPTWTPYDNTNIRRFTLSVGLRLHDRSAS